MIGMKNNSICQCCDYAHKDCPKTCGRLDYNDFSIADYDKRVRCEIINEIFANIEKMKFSYGFGVKYLDKKEITTMLDRMKLRAELGWN